MSLYFVTGMHRSGTSAATRVLNLLGVSLGSASELMAPQPDNPTGFWEPRKIARMNERLLRHLGGSWHGPPLPSPGWAVDPELDEWRREAAALLAEVRADGAAAHAIKDPRLAITMPLWQQTATPDRVILPVRDPRAVCQSLERRNGIPYARGAALWVRYVTSTLAHAADPVVVDYAELVDKPLDVTDDLCAALNLGSPDTSARAAITKFVQTRLDHAGQVDMGAVPELELALDLYAALRNGGPVTIEGMDTVSPVATGIELPSVTMSSGSTETATATRTATGTGTADLTDLRKYLHGDFSRVEGWCIPQLWQSIQPIDEVQRRNGIGGPAAEIGVFHGKFFIGLQKTKQERNNYAIDVFSMQRFNLDGAGVGSLAKVKDNITESGSSVDDVRFLEADSMALNGADIQTIREQTGGFSMFSVDGCHTVEHTINDTRVAMELTRPGGVIFVDDYYNPNWPGVQEGICKLYLTDSPRFVPLVATCNKLILCHISYHSEFLEYVGRFVRGHFNDTRVKPVKRFGYDTLTVLPNLQNGSYLAE